MDDHVGLPGPADGFGDGAHPCAHLEAVLGIEKLTQPTAHNGVLLDQQDGDHAVVRPRLVPRARSGRETTILGVFRRR